MRKTKNFIYLFSIRCLLGVTRRIPNEELNSTEESEPLLLPKNDLTHPGDIICPIPSLPESVTPSDQLLINFETTATNQNSSTTDVKNESPSQN